MTNILRQKTFYKITTIFVLSVIIVLGLISLPIINSFILNEPEPTADVRIIMTGYELI